MERSNRAERLFLLLPSQGLVETSSISVLWVLERNKRRSMNLANKSLFFLWRKQKDFFWRNIVALLAVAISLPRERNCCLTDFPSWPFLNSGSYLKCSTNKHEDATGKRVEWMSTQPDKRCAESGFFFARVDVESPTCTCRRKRKLSKHISILLFCCLFNYCVNISWRYIVQLVRPYCLW